MLREIILDLLRHEPDFEALTPTGTAMNLLEACKKYVPQVIVTTLRDDSAHHVGTELLLECPRLKLLDVRNDGRTGWLYELRLKRTPLGEVSPDSLVTAIRKFMHKEHPMLRIVIYNETTGDYAHIADKQDPPPGWVKAMVGGEVLKRTSEKCEKFIDDKLSEVEEELGGLEELADLKERLAKFEAPPE